MHQSPDPRFSFEQVFPLRDEQKSQSHRSAGRVQDERIYHGNNQECHKTRYEYHVGLFDSTYAIVDDESSETHSDQLEEYDFGR